MDIAYGWKGKGSKVHLVTEGNGLPLAFLVTAANVSEVTIGLKVVDRVRVPRIKGRPKQRPASLGADKSPTTAQISGMDCGGGIFNLPYPSGSGPTADAGPVARQRPMRPASSGGRWNGVMAGWTTGAGWSLGMTGTPKDSNLDYCKASEVFSKTLGWVYF